MNTSSAGFLVEVDGLRKQFGAVVAVRGLTLRIPKGGVFGLLGPNGSGKTTTIGLLLGLVKPTSGSMRLFGADVRSSHLAALHRIGAMVESPAFYPDLSGRANLRFFQGIGNKGSDLGEVNRLLELVGLADRADSRFRTYSLGMKQRLGIAYALLGQPELVFLDEPTNGLDPAGMAEVRELIAQLGKAGHTVVLSSHLLNEVEQVCDQVAILSRGELIAQGHVRDLLSTQGSVRLKTTDDARAAQILGALDWVTSVRSEEGGLVAVAAAERSGDLTRALSQQQVFVTEMVPRRQSLESYFLEVTARDTAQARAN
ncbi:MAG: ABC transporter ATP-binding protein [Pseudomonadota bacterium]